MGFTLVAFLYFGLGLTAPASAEPIRVFGAHHGYLFEVSEERHRRDVEMVMLEKPKETEPPISERIFNEKLSKEFQAQYQYRFGQTQAEQVINSPGRSDEYMYYTGESVTIQEYQRYQREFAEYMGRRLVEFHVDNWVKNDPDFRPVYQLKERVSNVDMEMKNGYKVKWKYNFSGPNMDVQIENPHNVEIKVRAEMSGVISSPKEVIYTLGYPLSKKLHITALHRSYDGVYQLIARRQLTKRMSTSLTGSIDRKEEGQTVKQDLILVGLSWTE